MNPPAPSRKKLLVAMNEALVLGSLRQHQLAEAAEDLNGQLQKEIIELERVEARRRLEVLTAANAKLKGEIVRRQAVEQALTKSEQHQRKLLEQSLHMQEQLRQLSRQIISAQEEERKRISRDLHDVIAQTLTGINLRLAALKKEAANPRRLDRHLARTQRLVEKSVDLIHEFAHDLRPAVLDDLGLIPALHSFVKLFSKRTRLHVHLKVYAGLDPLDASQRTILYRVAQEALTNVSRHARASRVEVDLHKLPGGVGLKITDNGHAFDAARVLHARSQKRLGLIGMRERLEMVGGHFDIHSVVGQGTTVIATLPAPKKLRAGAVIL